jgi:hypothetical protein
MEVARERVIAARPFCDTIAIVQEKECVCLRSGGCCDWAAILPRLHRVHGLQFLVFQSHCDSFKAFSCAPLQQQLLPKQSVASVADYTFLFVASLSADFCAGVKAAAAGARGAGPAAPFARRTCPRCGRCPVCRRVSHASATALAPALRTEPRSDPSWRSRARSPRRSVLPHGKSKVARCSRRAPPVAAEW